MFGPRTRFVASVVVTPSMPAISDVVDIMMLLMGEHPPPPEIELDVVSILWFHAFSFQYTGHLSTPTPKWQDAIMIIVSNRSGLPFSEITWHPIEPLNGTFVFQAGWGKVIFLYVFNTHMYMYIHRTIHIYIYIYIFPL